MSADPRWRAHWWAASRARATAGGRGGNMNANPFGHWYFSIVHFQFPFLPGTAPSVVGQKPKIMVRPLVRVTTEKPTREHETAGPCADCHHRLYRKRKRLADLYHQNERPAVPPCQPGQPV